MAAVEINNETLAQIINLLQNQMKNVNICTQSQNSSTNGSSIKKPDHDTQVQAVLYIVVVLMFYSITLATLLIKYMKQEQRTAQEEQVYQDFLYKTKQLALQQAKADFARRVSLQLVNMANFGQMKYPDHLGRLSTLVEVSEFEAIRKNSNIENEKKDKIAEISIPNDTAHAESTDEAITEDSLLLDVSSDRSEKVAVSRITVV